MRFRLLPQPLAVARLAPHEEIPRWATRGNFYSITRTNDELSIVCDESLVPGDVNAARGWRCLQLIGKFAFAEVGIAAEFTNVLARIGVSVLVVSTYDTDYLLVGAEEVGRAVEGLVAAGHDVADGPDA